MEKEKVIETIKLRIIAEHSKHKNIDWEEIAARKIYNAFEAWFNVGPTKVNNCVIPDVSNLCECSEKAINHIGPYYKECGKCRKQIL